MARDCGVVFALIIDMRGVWARKLLRRFGRVLREHDVGAGFGGLDEPGERKGGLDRAVASSIGLHRARPDLGNVAFEGRMQFVEIEGLLGGVRPQPEAAVRSGHVGGEPALGEAQDADAHPRHVDRLDRDAGGALARQDPASPGDGDHRVPIWHVDDGRLIRAGMATIGEGKAGMQCDGVMSTVGQAYETELVADRGDSGVRYRLDRQEIARLRIGAGRGVVLPG